MVRNRLRQWREEMGWSQDEVGAICGLSGMMISMLERGVRDLAPTTRIEVSRKLGVSVRELFPTVSLGTRGVRRVKPSPALK